MAKIIAEVECDLGPSVKFSVPHKEAQKRKRHCLEQRFPLLSQNVSFSDSEPMELKTKSE